jgi:hypothetical protein
MHILNKQPKTADKGSSGWAIGTVVCKVANKGVDYTELAQDRDKWSALVNTVMNLWVP